MSRFNICIIKPENYIHSLAFLELAELITYSLLDLNHDADLTYNKIQNNAINIVIGCHLLDLKHATILPPNTIIVNTEQLTSSHSNWTKTIYQWATNFKIWDYSEKNLIEFRKQGITHAKHLRIGYQKQLSRLNSHTEKDIDVLFYGCLNERRENILNQLTCKNLRVKSIFGMYGQLRDKWIERSHLVINIHYYDSQIIEIVRVFYLLTNSIAVISEVNETTSIDSIYKPAIKSCNYNDLTETSAQLINKPIEINNLRSKGFEEIIKYPQKLFTESILSIG
jgi:hypothetical protein